jgi:hypothetical protein
MKVDFRNIMKDCATLLLLLFHWLVIGIGTVGIGTIPI